MFLALIFCALMAVSLGAILLFAQPRRDDDTLAMRLQDLSRPEQSAGISLATVTANAGEAAGALQRAMRHHAFDSLRTLLAQAQTAIAPGTFLLRSAALGAALASAAVLFAPLPAVTVPAALAGGSVLPWLWLNARRKRRMRAFEEALPDAADLMGRALRAGHSVQQAIELVADETAGPLAEEFRTLHGEQKFGVPLREALRALAARVPSRDLQFLVTAIVVQKETGGDLIEILDRTTHVMRDRMRVAREVKTYTAQGRLTGWILSALPVVLLAITALVTPTYSAVKFHDPTGQVLLATAAGLIVTGSLVIRKVVQVEV